MILLTGWDKCQEDQEETDVCSNRSNTVYCYQNCHAKQEEGKRCEEFGVLACGKVRRICRICTVRVVEWNKRCTESEPEATCRVSINQYCKHFHTYQTL